MSLRLLVSRTPSQQNLVSQWEPEHLLVLGSVRATGSGSPLIYSYYCYQKKSTPDIRGQGGEKAGRNLVSSFLFLSLHARNQTSVGQVSSSSK